MSPESFIQRWQQEIWPPGEDDPLIKYPERLVNALEISNLSKEFLCKAGLPQSAAPSLAFDAQTGDRWETLHTDFWPSAEYSRVYLIGSGGCGDPIAIDGTANGQIVELLHEFQFERRFMNSSVIQLAACLLEFRLFVSKSRQRNGEDALVFGKIPGDLRAAIEEKLLEIDEAALNSGGWWVDELGAVDYMIASHEEKKSAWHRGIL